MIGEAKSLGEGEKRPKGFILKRVDKRVIS